MTAVMDLVCLGVKLNSRRAFEGCQSRNEASKTLGYVINHYLAIVTLFRFDNYSLYWSNESCRGVGPVVIDNFYGWTQKAKKKKSCPVRDKRAAVIHYRLNHVLVYVNLPQIAV